jgi:hypothetical protein
MSQVAKDFADLRVVSAPVGEASRDRRRRAEGLTLAEQTEIRELKKRVMEQTERHIQADQDRKFGGLYVDVAPNGWVVTPWDAIDPQGAARLLHVLGHVIRSYAEQFDGVDLRELYRAAQSGASQIVEALKSGDPDTIARTWAETLGREPE